MMTSLASRVAEALAASGKNQTELAEACSIKPPSVNNWLTGETKTLKAATALRAAKFLGVKFLWLTEGRGPKYLNDEETLNNLAITSTIIEFQSLSLIGEIQGGGDGFFMECLYLVAEGNGVVLWSTKDPNAYALRVRGDSMHPRYRAGEFVIIEPSIAAQPGDDVVVCCKDGRKMLKVFNWVRDDEAQFLSLNSGYTPVTLKLADIESMHFASGRAPRTALLMM